MHISLNNLRAWLLVFLVILLQVSCIGQKDPLSTASQPPPIETIASTAVAQPELPTNEPVDPAPAEPTKEDFPQTAPSALLPLEPGVLEQLAGAPRYQLALDIDDIQQSFRGTSTLTYTNQEEVALDRLYFRLLPNGGKSYGNGSLSVESLLVDGQPVQPTLSLENTVLEAALPSTLAPGEQTVIEFVFQGEIPGNDGAGYGIYSAMEGVLTLAGWFPLLAVYDDEGWNLDPVSAMGDSVYSDIAFFIVDLTTDKEQVIAATGVMEIEQTSAVKSTRRYTSGPVRDFVLVMSPRFTVSQRQVDGVTINAYTLPGHEEAGERVLDAAANALGVYNNLFGAYPYGEFDIAEAPMHYALGVEFPGLVLVSSELYASPNDRYLVTTTSHEVAHQWWYNLVGNDVFDEPWLDEGLATFSSSLFYEYTLGDQAQQQYLNALQNDYQDSIESGHPTPVNTPLGVFEEQGQAEDYSNAVYTRGALFFQALRERLGDQVFFEVLQDYYLQYQFKIASGEDLLHIFEEATGESLDDFYQQWLDLSRYSEAPAEEAARAISFAVIGDYGSGDHNAQAVAELVKRWKPDLIITVGDNNYPIGSRETIDDHIGQFYADYIGNYQGKYGPGAETNAFSPTPGNHDWDSERLQPYLDYFTLPGNEYYYDFRAGPVHFFALDTDSRTPDGVGRSSIQGQWLKQKLAESDAPWKVVYGHVPPYSSGYHGAVDWIRWPFKEWGATIYLCGHDHDYERLEVDGFPYIVNGLGGGETYYFLEPIPGSQARYVDGYGAMLVTASAEEIVFQFQTVEGEVIDTYAIRK